jgi:hypothetical protein
MEDKTKVALAVGAGYMLGRTKNLKLAFTVAGLLAGQRIRANPQALLKQASTLVQNNPQLAALQSELQGRMIDAAKNAAVSVATSRVEKLTETLRTRGEKKRAGGEADTEPEEPEDEYEEAAEEGEEEPQDEYEEAGEEEEGWEEPEEEAPPVRRAPVKKAPAKKAAPVKKAPAKKAPAKTAPAGRRQAGR